MPNLKADPTISALQAVYAALRPLEPQERDRVLNSVQALLGGRVSFQQQPQQTVPATTIQPSRPTSLIELIKEKQPKTNIDLITLFAYYRDQHEGKPRFSRNDLRAYFAMAKQNPPGNYDRDFVRAVKRGWLHEDGEDSYITSRGIEAIASGFPVERASSKRKPSKSRSARKPSAIKSQVQRTSRRK